MATQVGSLYTSLTLESSSFISNTKRAATAAEAMSGQIDKAFGLARGAAVGFLAAFSADKLIGLAKTSLDYAAGIGETAQQLGVSTRALQLYGFAATQVGVDQDTLEAGLAKLTRTLGEAQAGGKKQVETFAAVGISYKELARLTPDEAFRRVAAGLGKIEEPAKRAAIEVDLFGKAGQKLDTLLAGGTAAIDGFAREAAKLGVIISDGGIAKADEAADKISALTKVLSINISGVVAENAGAIITLVDALVKLAGAGGRGLQGLGDFTAGFDDIVKNNQGLRGLPTRLGALFGSTAADRGRALRFQREMMATGINDGSPAAAAIVPAAGAGGGKAKASAGPKAAADIYGGLSASAVRMGGLDTLNDVLGRDGSISQGLQAAIDGPLVKFEESLKGIAATAVAIPVIEPINLELLRRTDQFADDLSRGLGQAIINGQSLGDALVNSIKAAAAELISSNLLNLLKGDGSSGGVLGGLVSGIGSLFGGKRARGGSAGAGKAFLVGEQGPEVAVFGQPANIIPNDVARRMGGGRDAQDVRVSVEPSPLFVATVISGATAVARSTAGETLRSASRSKMPSSRGA